MWVYNGTDELYHYGVLGMKWGVHKYADKSGKLNAEGRKKYGVKSVDEWKNKKKAMKTAKRDWEAKANKKYRLDKYESDMDNEDKLNDLFKLSEEDRFTTYSDRYDRQVKKAQKYVDKNMMEQFGESSYKTWEKNENTKKAITFGAAVVGGLGIMAATMRR